MNFELEKSLEILERTPDVITDMLRGLSTDWTSANEGEGTWSAYDVVGHLVHGEKTDWVPRTEVILSAQSERRFEPFNRFAQFEESRGKSLHDLLTEFKQLRQKNLAHLRSKGITNKDLQKTGTHPDFGDVTLSQLLSTWVVHDLNHIAQISRVMAKHYKDDVGPWIEYLRILKS
jgi:uncharacterized damage-inducible protein DinB